MFQAPQQQLAPPVVCRQADWQQIRSFQQLQADRIRCPTSQCVIPLGAWTPKAACLAQTSTHAVSQWLAALKEDILSLCTCPSMYHLSLHAHLLACHARANIAGRSVVRILPDQTMRQTW